MLKNLFHLLSNYPKPTAKLSALNLNAEKIEELFLFSNSLYLSSGRTPWWVVDAALNLLDINTFNMYLLAENSDSDTVACEILDPQAEISEVVACNFNEEGKLQKIITTIGGDNDKIQLLAGIFACLAYKKSIFDLTFDELDEDCLCMFILSMLEELELVSEDELKIVTPAGIKQGAYLEFNHLHFLGSWQIGQFFAGDGDNLLTILPAKKITAAENAVKRKKALNNNYDFQICKERVFTDEENLMLQNNAFKMQNYTPCQVANDMVFAFYASNKGGFSKPLRAGLLYGPSGTGKSAMVQYLGYKLGVPVTTLQCSTNTDEYDLLGKPISLGLKGDGKIEYTETELTKAIKNGWIIEIQEAASIKEAGVLQCFNALLDDTELVQLPNGLSLTPHPNFMMVFTTNVNYEGCIAINQSLISRNQFVANVTLPSDKELKERLKSQLSWPAEENDSILDAAILAMHKINEYLVDNCLEDGVCDFRTIRDWLGMYLNSVQLNLPASLVQLAKYTVIPKATLESEHHDVLLSIIAGAIPED